MLKQVLVPLDHVPVAESLLQALGRLIARKETTVVLVHARVAPLGARMDPGREEETTDRARRTVDALARRLRLSGTRCLTVVREGDSAELILSVAGDYPEGMIAMSTRGRSTLSQAVFGSVTRAVVRASPVPVLLLPAPVDEDDLGVELILRRIVVPVDGSDNALRVLAHVAEIAPRRAEIIVAHVLPRSAATAESVGLAELVVARARRHLQDLGIVAETSIRSGDAAEEIVNLARHRQADLIACTLRGQAGLARLRPGRVTDRLLELSSLPLLVA